MEKPVKIALWACTGVALAFAAVAIYQQQNYSTSFIKETNNNLTAEERADYERQLQELENMLEQTENNNEKYTLFVRRGEVLHALGQLTAAQRSYGKALDIDPDGYPARWGTYLVQMDLGEKQAALKTLKALLIKNPEITDAWLKYIALEKEFNPDKIYLSSVFAEALSKTGNNIAIIKEYAKWLEETGNLALAREYWQQAIERDPANRSTYAAEIRRLETLISQQQ